MSIPLIDGRKVIVRFPSDKQLEQRTQSVKVLTKSEGDVKRTWTARKEGFDRQLLDALLEKDEATGEITDADATKVLDRLTEAVATDAVKEGATYRVTLRLPRMKVEHVFRIPTQQQVMDYDQSLSNGLVVRHGIQEFKITYGQASYLYDDLLEETEGYKDQTKIPISHKSVAISALLSAIERDLSADASEDF